MWWWVALGVALVPLVLLVVVALSVLSRLARLARAAARTQAQVKDAQAVQAAAAHLQERLTSLAEQAAGIQEHVDARKGVRAGG